MCVRMIAPEEVSISSTAANLPTDETEVPTDDMATTPMATTPMDDTPMATTPMDNTPMDTTPMATAGPVTAQSTTAAAETMCDQCNIDDIPVTFDPAGDVGADYSTTPRDPVDGCLRTEVGCIRSDGKQCDTTEMFVVNPTGDHSIADGGSEAYAILACANDGLYKWMDM
ncbi:hypothetical protein GCK72_007167 [Caenorhabditis remanei]|uniref:DUF281 domain-containing protein n=1 Tax=Caenorhabditis remanei TaxID=31234 RepID=A0A6A5HHA1_CAERE|nr:hypothetical protein GCK72_007167 [Caenorhabditis remanei]KAF1767208.1 hypothetical protein GCK72_007167 [Caenorhabditis remanei]